MSAKRVDDACPRVLRVGILQEGGSLDERVIRERVDVAAGTTERAALPVSSRAFPEHVELFVVRDGRWHLRIAPAMEGRVALADGVHSLDACVKRGVAREHRGAWLVPLDDNARGKATLAGVTFLFQFVPAPVEAPRPQLPSALRANLARDADWRYNTSLACFLSLALGALSWVEYGYDPVVGDDSDAIEFVARRIRMAPPEDDRAEEMPPLAEGARAVDSAQPAPPSRTNTASNGRPARPSPNGSAPAPARVDAAARRADEAAASAIRAIDASFAAIVDPFSGAGSARDQLQNQVLPAGTEDDLRNVHGVTTQAPSGVTRPGVMASASGVPGGRTLGHSHTIATTDGPTTGALAQPTGPRRPLVLTPSEPSTDTCDGDAGAVARALRNNLGGLRSCYERGVRDNPALAGRVTLRFSVGESGRATTVSAQGLTPEVDQCLAQSLRRIVFPVPACGAAEYTFPVAFDTGDR